jgi:hypothetical protein
MPKKTIQIRQKRIKTSVHSAGDSMMNRVKIWWMPKAEAKAIMTQATIIDRDVVQCSKRKKKCFIGLSRCVQ